MSKKVVVAMSGGVDSSVAASLLHEKGYDVMGATMRLWKEKGLEPSHTGNVNSHIVEARRIAEQLGIPFHVFDLEDSFEQEVIRYFCEEYGQGRTPNPCILCNRKIKFGAFWEKAKALGADLLSTGHYARLVYDSETERTLLKKGRDHKKDQSYFLFSLSQDQFGHALFPLGDFRKEEVRRRARELGLRVHDKPESQEVCFIREASYHPFVKKWLGPSIKMGPIMDRAGKVLGTHQGLPFYTIGQRRGLRLAKGKPLYVIEIDRKRNAIIVGGQEEVFSDHFMVNGLNWILPKWAEPSFRAQVKIRSNHSGAEAEIFPRGENEGEVRFDVPQKAITPGQVAVFYDGETVIGGGWIREVMEKGP